MPWEVHYEKKTGGSHCTKLLMKPSLFFPHKESNWFLSWGFVADTSWSVGPTMGGPLPWVTYVYKSSCIEAYYSLESNDHASIV